MKNVLMIQTGSRSSGSSVLTDNKDVRDKVSSPKLALAMSGAAEVSALVRAVHVNMSYLNYYN